MSLFSMRVPGVVLVTAVLAASCGGGQRESVDEFPEPPDSFERLGLGPRPDPVRWIRTTGDGGDRILYYEDLIDSYGEQREVTVHGALMITENAATQEKSYRWHEVHRKFDTQDKSIIIIKTDEGSGTVATEGATTANYGPVTIYRLNGSTPAEKFRSWATFGRELVVPAPKIEESHPLGTSVMLHALATPHVLEVTEFATEMEGYRLGLKRDDVLIIRLQRAREARAAVFKEGTQASHLVLTNTTTEPAFESSAAIDVYRFTAKAPGWADLQFNQATVGTFRVRVE